MLHRMVKVRALCAAVVVLTGLLGTRTAPVVADVSGLRLDVTPSPLLASLPGTVRVWIS